MAATILQVTLGAGATQVTTSNIPVKQIIFQNNATHVMRVGDSTVTTTKGISLAVSGGTASVLNVPGYGGYISNLSEWWVIGTNTDLLDIVYIT